MKDGFFTVAVATPHLKVADVVHNRDRVLELMHEAKERKAKLLVLPELTLTCSTASDLFFHDVLLEASLDALRYLKAGQGIPAGDLT